jgi:hypothetical protein
MRLRQVSTIKNFSSSLKSATKKARKSVPGKLLQISQILKTKAVVYSLQEWSSFQYLITLILDWAAKAGVAIMSKTFYKIFNVLKLFYVIS